MHNREQVLKEAVDNILEAPIMSVADVVSAGGAVSVGRFSNALPYWRGQPRLGLPLVPKGWRPPNDLRRQRNMAIRFCNEGRPRHPHSPRSDDYRGWLFLAQHYGLPTCLLDWTMSPLIATYFAVEKHEEEPGELIALHPSGLNKLQEGTFNEFPADAQRLTPLFAQVYDARSSPVQKTLAVMPEQADTRMMVQRSRFTIHGCEAPIESIDGIGPYLIRLVVPPEGKRRIKVELQSLDIRSSVLFPDLEHLAEDLAAGAYSAVDPA